MKITAYRKITEKGRVFVYEKIMLEIPMGDIIRYNYAGCDTFGAGHILHSGREPELETDLDGPYRPGRQSETQDNSQIIPYRDESGTRAVQGIIGYSREEDLIEFINSRIDMEYECQITNILRPPEAARRKKVKLNRELLRFFNDVRYPFVKVAGDENDPPVYRGSKLHPIRKNGVSYLVKRLNYPSEQMLFAWEKNQKIAGYSVPRPEFVYIAVKEQRRRAQESEEGFAAVFASEKFSVFDSTGDINKPFLDIADREGTAYSGTYCDILPDYSFEVFAVLRVPPRAEFEKHLKSGAAGGKAFSPSLEKIAASRFYAEPSLKAIEIKPGTPVIDDPAFFERIYSGLSQGIYMPENMRYEPAASDLPEKEQFILLLKAA